MLGWLFGPRDDAETRRVGVIARSAERIIQYRAEAEALAAESRVEAEAEVAAWEAKNHNPDEIKRIGKFIHIIGGPCPQVFLAGNVERVAVKKGEPSHHNGRAAYLGIGGDVIRAANPDTVWPSEVVLTLNDWPTKGKADEVRVKLRFAVDAVISANFGDGETVLAQILAALAEDAK